MKVLYVVGTNLSKNTSANISHNAYVQGLVENNCEIDILMASSSWGETDNSLPKYTKANYFTYNSRSWADKLKTKFKNNFDEKIEKISENLVKAKSSDKISLKQLLKYKVRELLKKIFKIISLDSELYSLEKTWLKNASRFKSDTRYDIVLSNSSPAASHKLVLKLLKTKKVSTKRWIQIWEDPWFYDVYSGTNFKIKLEEHKLLQAAQEVLYVSPITLNYQKKHFPDYASKMRHIPLPYLKIGKNTVRANSDSCTFGYFGDYYSNTRNLVPFYNSIIKSKANGLIYGDSDISLISNNQVDVSGRVTLDKLSKLQDESDVLVHLCNLKGGQIPGKIYHYSATNKPILFILDGTSEEIILIKEYFDKFDRYHFCENNEEDILNAIDLFKNGVIDFNSEPVLEFHPKEVVLKLLEDHK